MSRARKAPAGTGAPAGSAASPFALDRILPTSGERATLLGLAGLGPLPGLDREAAAYLARRRAVAETVTIMPAGPGAAERQVILSFTITAYGRQLARDWAACPDPAGAGAAAPSGGAS